MEASDEVGRSGQLILEVGDGVKWRGRLVLNIDARVHDGVKRGVKV